MISLFNLHNRARSGQVKFPYDGKSLVGTVIRAGVNNKTVVVLCSFRKRDFKMRQNYIVNRHYQVHDEHNFCAMGDKVVIRRCPGYTKTKNFYVEELIRAQGRAEMQPLQKDMRQTRWIEHLI